MNRRGVFKSIGVIVGGSLILPGCDFSHKRILESCKKLNITVKDKNLLAFICDVIIPAGGGMKGAKELEVENFVLVMVNDCYDKEFQSVFRNGLLNFKEYVKYTYGVDFMMLAQIGKENVLQKILDFSKIDNSKISTFQNEMGSVMKKFITSTKSLLIHGYTTSEYFMTEIMPYAMVPGPFKGKIEVKENEQINIYG